MCLRSKRQPGEKSKKGDRIQKRTPGRTNTELTQLQGRSGGEAM